MPISGLLTRYKTDELPNLPGSDRLFFINEFRKLERTLKEAVAGVETVDVDTTALSASVDALETDVAALDTSLTSLTSTVTSLSSTVDGLADDVEALQDRLWVEESSGSRTVTSADDRYTIIVTGTDQTFITLPDEGDVPDGFYVIVKNDMADRRTDVYVPGIGNKRLYPKQSSMYQVLDSDWRVLFEPGPWLIDQDRDIFVSDEDGDNANDGLHEDYPVTTQYGFNILFRDIDCGDGWHVTFQAAGELSDNLTFVQPIRGAIYATLQGDVLNRGNVTLPVGAAAIGIYVKHRGFLKIRSITFSGATANSMITADRNGGVDLYDCAFGTATSAKFVTALYNGSIEFADVCYFSGNCLAVGYADHGGKIMFSGFDHEVTVNMTVSVAWVIALNGGEINADPGGSFDLNGHTVTGERVIAAAMGIIRSADNTTTFYPGSAYTAPTTGFYT